MYVKVIIISVIRKIKTSCLFKTLFVSSQTQILFKKTDSVVVFIIHDETK